MDFASAVGMVSSVFALIGVAAKIIHFLDTLKEKWDEASLKILTLRSQVETFKGAFKDLYTWMQKNESSWYIGYSDSFIERLDSSLKRCTLLLGALEQKVRILSKYPENPSKRDKAVLLWTESGMKDISDSLQCQASAPMLLLQCRTLSQLSQQEQFLSSEPYHTVTGR